MSNIQGSKCKYLESGMEVTLEISVYFGTDILGRCRGAFAIFYWKREKALRIMR